VPESEADVVAQFAIAVNDAIAVHGFAGLGLHQLTNLISALPVVPENPDPDFYIGIGDPNLASSRTYAAWKRSTALEQIAQDGPVEVRLSQQWVVYTYAMWEEEYRPRLAAARGCDSNDIRLPLLGDLRRLRNDIVHHRAIATAANTGRCEVLTRWFEPGAQIYLRGEHFAEFVERFRTEVVAATTP
jgi:hypothetical protein